MSAMQNILLAPDLDEGDDGDIELYTGYDPNSIANVKEQLFCTGR